MGEKMEQAQLLCENELHDILNGSAILGAGGGGQFSEGYRYINLALRTDKFPSLIKLSALSDSTLIAGPYLLGSVSTEENCDNDTESAPSILKALHALKKRTNQELGALIPIEIGVSNVALALYLSALFGIPVVDADPTGRSVPECTHSTFAIHSVPVGTIVAATRKETFIIEGVENDERGEDILRSICTVSGNDLSVIDHILPVEDLKHAMIEGTMSKAWALGKCYREARMAIDKTKVGDQIARKGKGKIIFKGRIEKTCYKVEHGFTRGDIFIEGNDIDFKDETMVINFKNENMHAKINDQTVVTVPEIITVFNEENGDIMLHPDFTTELAVVVIVLPAPDAFLTEKGLELFGPNYLGLKEPFKSAIN